MLNFKIEYTMMTTFVKKYNFAEFINFIRSIDGDFNNASIEYITDAIYDDTYDNNEDELANSDKSGIIDVLDIIKAAMTKKRAKNITVTIADNEYISDVINVWMKLGNNPTYVLSLCKGIYEEKINKWLELN